MSPSPATRIAALPKSAFATPERQDALAKTGVTIVDENPDAYLIDWGHPEGRAVREKLASGPEGARLPIVAVVPEGEDLAHQAELTDLVASDKLATELPMRLRRAVSLRRAQREATQRQRDLQVLLELTARYAESAEVEAMLHDVTRRLADEMQIDRVALIAVDDVKQTGWIIAASDDAALKNLRIDLVRYPEIREVVRTGKPVIVEDAPSHPLLEDVKTQVAARGIASIAALPVALQGKVLGVLLLRRSGQRGAFSLREIDFLHTVAHATAVALKHERQLDEVRDEREQEKHARLAAEARAQALKKFESYFEHLSDGVAILDAKACVLSLNPAGSRLFEVSSADAVGRHLTALMNPSDEGLVLEMLTAVVQRGQARLLIDVPARTLAGRQLTVSVSGAPLKGESAMAILSFRDVTEKRALADELQKTNDFLARLIDSSVDAIIAADMTGRIMVFNKAAEAITGYTMEDVKAGLSVTTLYSNDGAREVMQLLRAGEHGGIGRLTLVRKEILTKNKTRVPVNMTAAILYEGSREVASVGIFTDLRDRLMLERRLSDAEERLEESEKNAVLVALAGTAAHELNQPLTSVLGYAELLKRKVPATDPNYRSIDVLHREAERMADIVRKIGTIVRYETTPYIGDQRIVDLDKATAREK